MTALDTLKFKLSKTSAPAGKVVFKIKNGGHLSHDFRIAGKTTPMIAGGKTATLTVTPVPEPVGVLAACAAAAGLVRVGRRIRRRTRAAAPAPAPTPAKSGGKGHDGAAKAAGAKRRPGSKK